MLRLRSAFAALALAFGLAAAPAAAQDPLEAFRKRLEDGQKIRDQLLGRTRKVDTESAIVADHAEVTALYRAGRLREALAKVEVLLPRVAAHYGETSDNFSGVLGSLTGSILQDLGRYEEAIAAYRRAADITRQVKGDRHAYYARDLGNLADLLRITGRLDEARAETERALAIVDAQGDKGEGAGLRALLRVNLGEILRGLGRHDEAEAVLTEAIEIAKKLPLPPGEIYRLVAAGVSNRALVHMEQGKLALALEKLDQVRAIEPRDPLWRDNLGFTIDGNRAFVLSALGRHAEAEAVARTLLRTAEQVVKNEPWLDPVRAALGVVLVRAASLEPAKRAEGRVLLRRALDRLLEPGRRVEDLVAPNAQQDAFNSVYVAALADAHRAEPAAEDEARLFRAMQVLGSGSEAARALRQSQLRAAVADAATAVAARQLQDAEAALVAARRERQRLDARDRIGEQRLDREIAELSRRRADALAGVATSAPQIAAAPLETVTDAATLQSRRAQPEAIVWLAALPQPVALFPELYAWVLTREGSMLVPLEARLAAVRSDVAAVRCGVDAGAWVGDGARQCNAALGIAYPAEAVAEIAARKRLPPFDPGRAHRLYASLLGKLEPMLAGVREIVIVPFDAVAGVPFHALPVAMPVEVKSYADLPYLARRHAVTILPSVASLAAVRSANHARASEPYLGIGNPLLDGKAGDAREARDAELARKLGSCTAVAASDVALASGATQSARGVAVSDIRRLAPMPATAREVCEVAGELGGAPGDVLLGAAATETELKSRSRAGALARYRVLHVATHGVLAGQLAGGNEPGLILTPPAAATGADDGYLAASEVAALDLAADWVVLSACNTAAGASRDGGEALSGLARAFFYAGARSLLVSNWEVYSKAAVRLVTDTLPRTAAAGGVGRAEALRLAMIAILDDRGAPEAEKHPAYWAAFSVVGEGGPLAR